MDSSEIVEQFFFYLFNPIILIPAIISVIIIWRIFRSDGDSVSAADLGQTRFGGGRLGLWATGIVAAVMAFIDGALWLTWSADDHGQGFTPPGLPPPDSFAVWQIVGFGFSILITNLLAAWWARRIFVGGLAAALGTTIGFAGAMILSIVGQAPSQEGIGIMFVMCGFWPVLTIINLIFGGLRTKKAKNA